MSESEDNEDTSSVETGDDLQPRNAIGIADELEHPERAEELRREDGILSYRYYAEAIARRLDEDSSTSSPTAL